MCDMRIHTLDRPFKCEMCDHSTIVKKALTLHMRIHPGEKPSVKYVNFPRVETFFT